MTMRRSPARVRCAAAVSGGLHRGGRSCRWRPV